MCGISGVFSRNATDLDQIHLMVGALEHRGPDAHGVFSDPEAGVALGHNRLSIIDLTAAANQPFTSANGRYIIVFNGEVYNFQFLRDELRKIHGQVFKTTSDTEVIIEGFSLWGPAMASRLDGMFALAIFDRQEKKLFLLRDRLGKKPLYYYLDDDLFAFASEIKSLCRMERIRQRLRINRSVISSFLHLGYIPEPHTIYQNMFKFPAGHAGEIDIKLKIKLTRYWTLTDKLDTPRINNESDAKRQLGLLLDQAVQKRLISDVPLGTFLSGGVDSSLVTAIASKHVNSPLKTFSIGFSESKFDESKFASAVSKHLGTDHTQYRLHEREATGLLESYLRHFDEPFADTSAIPTMLVSKLARQEVKVALTGDGGDELFQGYGSYTWAKRLDSTAWRMGSRPIGLGMRTFGSSRLKRVAHLFERPLTGGMRSHIFSQEQYFFSQREIKRSLLKNEVDFSTFEYEDPLKALHLTPGERQALFDLQYYLKDDLLVKVDRASMFFSLECRCPLLDHHVVEYAFSIGNSLKVRDSSQKYLLKALLANYLPQELINRPKWGFSVPLVKWLKGDLRFLIDDYLKEEVIEDVGLFNVHYIKELKKQFFDGVDYINTRLWAIIVLHKWWKENAGNQ